MGMKAVPSLGRSRGELLPIDKGTYVGDTFCMDRTLVVHLKPTPVQAHVLLRTMTEHTACFNAVARLGFETGCSNGVELHNQTYYPLRAQYPDLPAQLGTSPGFSRGVT